MKANRNQYVSLFRPFGMTFWGMLLVNICGIALADETKGSKSSDLELEAFVTKQLGEVYDELAILTDTVGNLQTDLDELELRIERLEAGGVPQAPSPSFLESAASRVGLEKPLPRSGAASPELLKAIREAGVAVLKRVAGPEQQQGRSSNPIAEKIVAEKIAARRAQMGLTDEDGDTDENSDWEE